MVGTAYSPKFAHEIPPIVTPALLFGVAFDLLLFGILTAQVYIYYLSFPRDRILLKVAVGWVYLAGVAQTGLALVDLDISFLAWAMGQERVDKHDGWIVVLLGNDHLEISITALTSAVAIVIQSLYAHKIYSISRKLWVSIMIICLSFCQFASGIFGAYCYNGEAAVSALDIGDSFSREFDMCRAGFTRLWGPTNIACDLTITISMVTFLLKHRKRTISRQMRSHVTRIVQIVVETGMATTVLMIIYTVLLSLWSLGHPAGGIFFPLPGLMMSKVYSNSMLVLLNNRITIANGRNAVESFEFVEVSPFQAQLVGGNQLQKRDGNSRASAEVQNGV